MFNNLFFWHTFTTNILSSFVDQHIFMIEIDIKKKAIRLFGLDIEKFSVYKMDFQVTQKKVKHYSNCSSGFCTVRLGLWLMLKMVVNFMTVECWYIYILRIKINEQIFRYSFLLFLYTCRHGQISKRTLYIDYIYNFF